MLILTETSYSILVRQKIQHSSFLNNSVNLYENGQMNPKAKIQTAMTM